MEKHDSRKKVDVPTPKEIPLVKVIIHNDQTTPLAVVLQVLSSVFHKDQANAAKIAQEAEAKGKAIVDRLHFELAEFKIQQAKSGIMAGYPLKFTIER